MHWSTLGEEMDYDPITLEATPSDTQYTEVVMIALFPAMWLVFGGLIWADRMGWIS